MKEYISKNKKIIIICLYLILLLGVNYITRKNYDKIQNESTALIIYGKENHQKLFDDTNVIISYRRALSFSIGEDNDTIYKPESVLNPDGSISYKEPFDNTKLNWDSFPENNNIITAYRGTTCNMDLEKYEVALNFNYYTDEYSKFLNKEIIFKYQDQHIPLKIKEIGLFDIYSLICISDELYDELIEKEKNYIYDIKTDTYRNHQKIYTNLEKLENNSFYSLSHPSSQVSESLSKKLYTLGDFIDFLAYINLITGIVIIILIICFVVNILQKKLNQEE